MLTVSLKNVRLHTFIGLHPQEMKTGNKLSIDLKVSVPASIEDVPLIDYEWLNTVVLQSATQPLPLLEDLIKKIFTTITAEYLSAKIFIQVSKLNPPLKGEVEAAVVSYQNY